ncbi:hypothetical protein SDJN03_20988, partial [Cucurbita argyrosperma subsp. sororia]
MLKRNMPPIAFMPPFAIGIVHIKLPLPIPLLHRLALFPDVINKRPKNGVPVSAVESEMVESFLIGRRVMKNWFTCGRSFAGSPPDFDAIKFIGNFFVIIHTEYQRLAIFDRLSSQALVLDGAPGGEVVLNSGEGFTSAETLAGVLREGVCDVRIKRTN